MLVIPFSGKTQRDRQNFWDTLARYTNTIQKLQGKGVAVKEFRNKGTEISIPDDDHGRQGGGGPDTHTGACCSSGECSILTSAECADAGGNYLGNDTTCDHRDCTQGACCIDGVCSITTEEGCAGEYHGDGTICDFDCAGAATGACCDAMGGCTTTTRHGCSGTYLGDGSSCSPGVCDSTTRACCYALDFSEWHFSCASHTATDCAALGGNFDPHSLFCDDRCVCTGLFFLPIKSCFHGPCPISCSDSGGTWYDCCSGGGGASTAPGFCDGDGREPAGCSDMVGCTGSCFEGCVEQTWEECICACPGGTVTANCGGC